MFDSHVPRIQRGQSYLARKDKGTNLIGKQKLSRSRDRDERGRRRPLRESEYGPSVTGWIKLLLYQHRQVLRGRVPEDGTKNSNVKAATVAHPDHRLRRGLIRNTQARRQVCETIRHVLRGTGNNPEASDPGRDKISHSPDGGQLGYQF